MTRIQQDYFPELFKGLPEALSKLFQDMEAGPSSLPTNHYYQVEKDRKVAEVIEVACAGIAREDISIQIKNRALTITINKRESDQSNRVYVSRGTSQRYYNETWTLGPGVDLEKITSKLENGLLVVTLPIKQPEKVTVDIEVQ